MLFFLSLTFSLLFRHALFFVGSSVNRLKFGYVISCSMMLFIAIHSMRCDGDGAGLVVWMCAAAAAMPSTKKSMFYHHSDYDDFA